MGKIKTPPRPHCSIFVKNNFIHILPPRCGSKSFTVFLTGKNIDDLWKEGKGSWFQAAESSEIKEICAEGKKKRIPIICNIREPVDRAISGLDMVYLSGHENDYTRFSWNHCVPFLTHLPTNLVTHIIPFHTFKDFTYINNHQSKDDLEIKKCYKDVSLLDYFDYKEEQKIFLHMLKKIPVMTPVNYLNLIKGN